MPSRYFIIIIAFFPYAIFAQSASLHLGGSIGLLSGQGEEIVYRDEMSKYKLSQLLWNMKPLVYAGVNANFDWKKAADKWGFFAEADFRFGFPGETGIMEDRDWISPDNPDWLTHYSSHKNITKKSLLFEVAAGFSFPLKNSFRIKPFLVYQYMNFFWQALGGSSLYPDSDGGHGYSTQSNLEVGNYKQTFNIVSPALSLSGEFNRWFSLEITIKVSPFIWVEAIDNHLMRNLVVTEQFKFGFFYEPSLCFSFKPNAHVVFTLLAAYRNISGLRGDSKYEEAGNAPYVYANSGGAGLEAFSAGLTFSYKVF